MCSHLIMKRYKLVQISVLYNLFRFQMKYWQISIIAHATETISQISKFTQTMIITIEVRDENDCFPTFSTDDYFFYLTLPTVDGCWFDFIHYLNKSTL